jgi:hypothetical protein
MLALVGLFLIAAGVVFIRWPTVLRRGIWLKTSIAIRTLSEDGYRSYMQKLGFLYVTAGVGLIGWTILHHA